MDIRFIAIIFLIAALMEMISKALKKKRGVGIEDGSGAESVDPLRRALEETPWSPELDEDTLPGRDIPVPGAGERRVRVRVEEPESTVEPVPTGRADWDAEPERPPREAKVVEQWPPRRAAEGREPVRPAEPTQVLPYRDRAPRQIEVRSREARPLPPRPSAERRPVPVVAATARKEVAAVREGAVRGGGLDLGSVSGLRRLVVAREVLGPPLALRTNDREPGSAE